MTTPVSLKLQTLRERSGMTVEYLARCLGYDLTSEYEHFEDPDRYHPEFLPLRLVEQLIDVLPGFGDPTISAEEIIALGPPRYAAQLVKRRILREPGAMQSPTSLDPERPGYMWLHLKQEVTVDQFIQIMEVLKGSQESAGEPHTT